MIRLSSDVLGRRDSCPLSKSPAWLRLRLIIECAQSRLVLFLVSWIGILYLTFFSTAALATQTSGHQRCGGDSTHLLLKSVDRSWDVDVISLRVRRALDWSCCLLGSRLSTDWTLDFRYSDGWIISQPLDQNSENCRLCIDSGKDAVTSASTDLQQAPYACVSILYEACLQSRQYTEHACKIAGDTAKKYIESVLRPS